MAVIEIKNMTKDFGNQRGIFDVSFQVEKGEVFGFLGPNGAGKTTTIRNLMGFIRPDKGNCKIKGKDCFEKAAEIQKFVGYIPGEIAFMPDMTGMEFIEFMAAYRGLDNLTKANELIEFFDLDTRGIIRKMSKGTRQKVGIIVALMHDPEILILDEPTSGLDPLMQNKFVDLIKKEKEAGKTILLSSHMFEEVEKTCSVVSIIKEGCIVTIDSIANLKKAKTKKYIITFQNKKDRKSFCQENLEIIDQDETRAIVIVENNMKEFIKALQKYDIIDIESERQSLENIFLKYYGGDNHD